MSTKLPLEIQRNYTISNERDHWKLKCHVCNQAWKLNKPKKGEDIHGGNILALLDHAASHPIPEEEEVVEETPPTSKVVDVVVQVPEPKPKDAPLVAKVIKHRDPNPLSFKVEWFGNQTFCHLVKVSHFKVGQDFPTMRQVQRVSDNQYNVVLLAANSKHAQLMGERLIKKFFQENGK